MWHGNNEPTTEGVNLFYTNEVLFYINGGINFQYNRYLSAREPRFLHQVSLNYQNFKNNINTRYVKKQHEYIIDMVLGLQLEIHSAMIRHIEAYV